MTRRGTLPDWLFAAMVAAAGPLILFHYGAFHWFLRDEWIFLADRGSSPFSDLMEPHGGSHWVAVPRLIYLALWEMFGVTTYRPYQLCVVVLHLAVVVQLRVVMRRAGVSAWLATAAAAVLLLFGPGQQNIVWAFQVTFTGSLAFGLAHLLLADHDGPIGRRDLMGLGCGLLAIASSGVGITTTVAVAVAVLWTRGWKPALLHTVPLAVIYLGWAQIFGASSLGEFGSPPLSVLVSWVRGATLGAFVGLGHFEVVSWLLAVMLVVGMALVWRTRGGRDLGALRAQLALPIGLVVAALFFATTTGVNRWWVSDPGPRASRYTYLGAALLLPLLAVAAQAIARRWAMLTPVLVALFLLPIPFNVSTFGTDAFGTQYMEGRRYVLTTAVRMPFAHDVPRDVQPLPDPYASEAVTIGFLLTAAANGDLTPSTVPLTAEVLNEFRVRLGVAQHHGERAPTGCSLLTDAVELDPEQGDVVRIGGPVAITTVENGQATSKPVRFDPALSGDELTIELPDLHLQVGPWRRASSFRLCGE